MRRLTIVCAVGAACCSSEPVRPPDVVYTGRAVAIAAELLLTDGGTLVCARGDRYVPRTAEGVVQLTARGVPLARDGDVFELSCESNGSSVPRVYAAGVAQIIGPNVFLRADGSTFFQIYDTFRELPELTGSTSCNRHVCVKDGTVLLNSSTWAATGDPNYIPALGMPPRDATIAQSFATCGQEKVLAADGRVHDVVYVAGPPATLSFVPIDALPRITRIDGTFMYDRDGNAYYTGVVWAPDDPPHLQWGLSTTMLPPGSPTFACHCVQKVTSTCVGPTLVPKLKDARMGSISGLATYAIQPDGTVKCWATEPTRYSSNAPRCLSFD